MKLTKFSAKKLMLVLVVLLVLNFGFDLSIVQAWDPWSQMLYMQQMCPGSFGRSGTGARMGGFQFNNWGYNAWQYYNGPSFPYNRMGQIGSISQYDYRMGPPTSPYYPSGGDGNYYGTYVPGAWTLYGMYGYGRANPYGN